MRVDFLLLSGGKSIRFKSDKTVLEYKGKSITQGIVEKAKETGLYNDIYIASNPGRHNVKSRYEIENTIEIDDIVPDIGPIGGIYSALLKSKSDMMFVWACDMPFYEKNITDRLIYTLEKSSSKSACARVNGRLEPLVCAFFVNDAKDVIKDMIAECTYKIMDFHKKMEYACCDFSDERFFYNINYESDYIRLKNCDVFK